MMEKSDLLTLQEMQREIDDYSDVNLGKTAERLLLLRDRLRFDDASWYDELTQQVATLDSASTFFARNEAESRQVRSAVKQALDQIKGLICTKLDPASER